MNMNRFRVVVVSKYLGMYRAKDHTAYAIADYELANSIVSRKFDSQADAQLEANRLNRKHSS